MMDAIKRTVKKAAHVVSEYWKPSSPSPTVDKMEGQVKGRDHVKAKADPRFVKTGERK